MIFSEMKGERKFQRKDEEGRTGEKGEERKEKEGERKGSSFI